MTDQPEPERLDAPNQQVVRADGSHPADEGSGGGNIGTPVSDTEHLDAMTKAELLEEAERRGVAVDAAMTKADIRAAIGAPPTDAA